MFDIEDGEHQTMVRDSVKDIVRKVKGKGEGEAGRSLDPWSPPYG
jgi:hypothetical protein